MAPAAPVFRGERAPRTSGLGLWEDRPAAWCRWPKPRRSLFEPVNFHGADSWSSIEIHEQSRDRAGQPWDGDDDWTGAILAAGECLSEREGPEPDEAEPDKPEWEEPEWKKASVRRRRRRAA